MANYGSGQGGYGQGGGYGQSNPYGQQPTGNRYGQQQSNPYGQQSEGNQYGQQSNPYAQQSNNPYGGQQGNPYAQQQGNPYGQQQQQSNPYGQQQQSNPYGQQQQSNTHGQPQRNPYGQGPGLANTQPRYDNQNNQEYANGAAAGESIPMGPVGGGDSRSILNDCRDIDRGIDSILRNLEQIKLLQQRRLDDPDASRKARSARELQTLDDDTQALTSSLKDRMKKIKQRPGAGDASNRPTITRVNKKLQDAIQQTRKIDAEFGRKLQEQNERQYRIVRPDASEAEVQEWSSSSEGMQVFAQAALQSDRRGQSQSALREVQNRHEDIQKIEQKVIELARMWEDLNQQVVLQETPIVSIQQGADNVQTDVSGANTQLDSAIVKARARNRKKWWCLGIVVAIILVIVIIILILKFGTSVFNGNSGK